MNPPNGTRYSERFERLILFVALSIVRAYNVHSNVKRFFHLKIPDRIYILLT